jgi:hypothetical protein
MSKWHQRKGKRYVFRAPVEIRWYDSEHQSHSVIGSAVDVSVSGLAVAIPVQVQPEQELRIIVKGVEVCGGAVMRYLQPCESGFKAGLYFRLTLLVQNIPEIDELLLPSLSYKPGPASFWMPMSKVRYWSWRGRSRFRLSNSPKA